MILLIDNYDSFTWNLVQRLGELDPTLDLDRDLRVVRNDQITPEAVETMDGGKPPSHIVISPGPCTPNEAGVSGAVIERFAGRVPILGVCLGHQCMAAGSGMTVTRHRIQMHGKTSEIHHDGRGVFAGLPSPFTAMRYHSLVVVPETIPVLKAGQDGWEVSAWTFDVDAPKQRVVMGLRRVWGGKKEEISDLTFQRGGASQGGANQGRASQGGESRAGVRSSARQPLEGVQFHPESFMTAEGPRLLGNFLGMGEGGRVSAIAVLGG